MNRIKQTMIFTMMALQLGTAFANNNDPVTEQINITRSAVEVALEEIAQGDMEHLPSYDAELKVKSFNEEAAKALTKFELTVRQNILLSLSPLVNQYNLTLKNQSLSSAKPQILEGLLNQMKVLAADRSRTYKNAYLELYSVLPDVPVMMNYSSSEFVSDEDCGGLFYDCESHKMNKIYEGEIYSAKLKTQDLMLHLKAPYEGEHWKNQNSLTEENSYRHLVSLGYPTKSTVRTMVLEGCYTSTCYFQMITKYMIWKAMVESSLSRDIAITLEDGKVISISKNVSEYSSSINLVDTYLTGITTEGLVNNLPLAASQERVEILSSIDKALSNQGWKTCSAIRKLKDKLCNETRESCLQASEVELFKDRFNSKISCLAK